MDIILINREINKYEEKEILKVLHGPREVELYANTGLPESISGHLKGKVELSAEDKRKINYSIFKKILEFGELKAKGHSVTDNLMIENASIWHYHKFRIYFFIRNLYYDINLIEQLAENYKRVIVYYRNDFLEDYEFTSKSIQILSHKPKHHRIQPYIFLKYAAYFLMRVTISLWQIRKIKEKKHLIVDNALNQTTLNLNTLKQEPGNCYLDYMFEKLDNEFVILDISDIPRFTEGKDFKFKPFHTRINNDRLFGEHILFFGLISKRIRKQLGKSLEILNTKYQMIQTGLKTPLDKMILKYLKSLHYSSKLYLLSYLSYKSFFTKYHFENVSSIDENSPRLKSILDAARSLKIKTIGIQHGAIHELHPAYIYTVEDKKRKIVTDLTLVWGSYWKELLTNKGNYNKDSIIITGQPRTDIIPKLNKSKDISAEKVFGQSDIVVFASQPQRDPDLRKQSAADVFSAIRDLKNVMLIIKLHPVEKNDFNYYHDIAKEVGCTNYKLVLDYDLYLLLFISSAVITCFSTVGLETAYFKKPLVILDHLKQDIQGYYKEGIAMQASNSTELKSYLNGIINREITIDETSYSKYVSKYVCRIDGQASNRILQIIKDPGTLLNSSPILGQGGYSQ